MNKTCFLIFLFFLTFPFLVKSQTQKPTEWTLYDEITGIQIFYKYEKCNLVEEGIFQELVLLRFVNTNNFKIQISWSATLSYNGISQPQSVSNNEYHYILELDGGSVSEGNCDLNCDKSLRIFSKFLNYSDKSELTDFKLLLFQTKPL